MSWENFGDTKSSSNAGYVLEGNIKKFIFTDSPQRVRFLTQDVDIEQVMSDNHMSREEAKDFIARNISANTWVMPKSYWEHSIKSIQGQRFFSTVACIGKNKCLLCLENDKFRSMSGGMVENKLLPYPIRRRFLVPAWVYDLKQVLYVTGSEDFFNSVARYVNRHGTNVDFELLKRGKGFDTKYEVVFLGESKEPLPQYEALKPCEVDLYCGDDECKRRIAGEKKQNANFVLEPNVEPVQPAINGEFVVPFGTHKGKTFEQIELTDGIEYIKFLAENSTGVVQSEAQKYLDKK